MSLDLTKPADVADLFVDLCTRLRAMGACKVEALGMSASFPLPVAIAPSEPAPQRETPREHEEPLSAEGRDLQARAKRLAAGGGP